MYNVQAAETGRRKAGRAVVAALPSREVEKLPYNPTPSEREAGIAYFAAQAKKAPRLKVAGRSVKIDHPDPAFGLIAMLKAVGSTGPLFPRGPTSATCQRGLARLVPRRSRNELRARGGRGDRAARPGRGNARSADGGGSYGYDDVRPTARPRRQFQQQDSAQTALNKLARTFAAQVEALKRYRSSGEQKMTVQHVHVAEGGQAIVGNVSTTAAGGRGHRKTEDQPHALGYAASVAMPSEIEEEREAVPRASGSGE